MGAVTYFPQKNVFEDSKIFKALIPAHRNLAELKGLIHSLPNEKILLSNLVLQEAKDSSAIENIITTQDSMYKYQIQPKSQNPVNKEIYNYARALNHGWKKIRSQRGMSLSLFLEIQKIIEPKRPGFRKVPGTVLKNSVTEEIIYTPPPPEEIPFLMSQLERFINEDSYGADPLVKMAVIHHWFESIQPFYDGNRRVGRIINILFLVLKELLDSPALYLSRYINQNKSDYYRLLQQVKEEEAWSDWILYILKGVDSMSRQTADLITDISDLFQKYKKTIRDKHKFYCHDLMNNIFSYPYTTVAFLEKDMKVSRATATRYLEELADSGVLEKNRLGRESYYINRKFFELLKKS